MIQKKPIGFNFILGSGTTYTGKPPSFNIAYLDPVTLIPVQFETIAFDLEHANKFDEPKWDLVIDYVKEYNLPDLSPQSFMDHSMKIYEDADAAKQYRENRYVKGPKG
jgi:hypothetical protein